MKAHYAAAAPAPPPPKRMWRWFGATVLVLVFFSLFAPASVLVGLHRRFHSGYLSDDHSMQESSYGVYLQLGGWEANSSEDGRSRIGDLIKNPALSFEKNWTESITSQPDWGTSENNSTPTGHPTRQSVASEEIASVNRSSGAIDGKNYTQGLPGDENGRSCQLEFGSYCLWSLENKETMKDSTVKRLKDQLFVARAYYPSIAKLNGKEKLTYEMKQNIQEHERMLSEATSDDDLPLFVVKRIELMDQAIAKAKSCAVECQNVEKKLRQLLDLTEDEAHFHMKQSAFLYHLGVQTLPKSFHCLLMRLTVEYFKSPSPDLELPHSYKLESPELQHYVIFSRNILAASVTVNSTVMNSEESENKVFHLVTDAQNFYAFKYWFLTNSYQKATVQVLNFEDFGHLVSMGIQKLSSSEEFRISLGNIARPEYVSTFGHSQYLLPDMFTALKKVVVLDDDVVVRRDLSFLWNLDIGGKVISAIPFCGVRFDQPRTNIGKFLYEANSCLGMSGLNVVDLDKWRGHNLSAFHHGLLQKLQNGTEASWRAASLPISLLAFRDLIHPMESGWVQSGLGHNFGINHGAIRKAVALHYNGNMKPWLDFGIPKYKKYWRRFLTREDRFLAECNVNP